MLANCSSQFESAPDSPEHCLLRDTAWMGGEPIEGRYLLGMLIGENLFNVDDSAYYSKLTAFISSKFAPEAASIFCTNTNAHVLTPYLLALYAETDFPPFSTTTQKRPSRNRKIAPATIYLLGNLNATIDEIAKHLGTTAKQVLRLSDITYAKQIIDRHRTQPKR